MVKFQPVFQESIRGDMVFLVQSTFSPADNIMELLLMIDAARRASAYKVIAVILIMDMPGRIEKINQG